ncbi:MAG: hypothetical protein P1V51_07510 [Deltaproteobacteria bacterium]|nr:hypothetical protein [Deltaproteobacteria bacterium]
MRASLSFALTCLVASSAACAGKQQPPTPTATEAEAPLWLEACTAKGDPSSWFITCDRLFANFGKLTEISAEAQVDAWLVGARGGFAGEITSEPGSAAYLGVERPGLQVAFLGPDSQPLFSGHVAAWDEDDGSVRQVACVAHGDIPAERCAYLRDWFAEHQALPRGMSQGVDPSSLFDVRGWMASVGTPLPESCSVKLDGSAPAQVSCPGGMLVLAVMDLEGGVADPQGMTDGLASSLINEYRRTGSEVTPSRLECAAAGQPLSCHLLEMKVGEERIDSLIGLVGEAPAVFVQCIQSKSEGAPPIPCPLQPTAPQTL